LLIRIIGCRENPTGSVASLALERLRFGGELTIGFKRAPLAACDLPLALRRIPGIMGIKFSR